MSDQATPSAVQRWATGGPVQIPRALLNLAVTWMKNQDDALAFIIGAYDCTQAEAATIYTLIKALMAEHDHNAATSRLTH